MFMGINVKERRGREGPKKKLIDTIECANVADCFKWKFKTRLADSK